MQRFPSPTEAIALDRFVPGRRAGKAAKVRAGAGDDQAVVGSLL